MTSTTPSNEIAVTRLYNAPVALVWDAWTNDARVGQWWGPRGFSLTTHEKDLRAGGHWSYTMHGPDGKDWPNYTRYHEVEPQARLVYDHGASSADAAPMFRVVATFRDVGGRTELVMRMQFPSAEAAAQTRVFIKAAGGYGTWDRLAEYVEEQTSGRKVFVINRSFEAPIETVFDMWTVPSHLAQWLPPTGMDMRTLSADIRTGGHCAMMMYRGDFAMYGRTDYREVTRPSRIVYTQSFTEADGTITRHPGSPTWPLVMLITVEFTPESPTLTRVTLTTDLEGKVTPEELDTFTAERGGMTGGWSGSFDKLDALLSGAAADV